MIKRVILISVVVLIVIQFIRPEKNQSAAPSQNAVSKYYTVSSQVHEMLLLACNDCHSNNTKYPWYSEVQPVAWLLSNHVNEGKEHLNFDEFASYSRKKQDHVLEEIVETLEDNSMPLSSYTIVHKDAILSDNQKKEIIAWANTLRAEIKRKM